VASHEEEKDLPLVWPFLLAGVLVLLALAWFCLGFAIRDLPEPHPDLPAFWGLFFAAIAVAAVMSVVAAISNLSNEYARQKKRA
jgi:drug/metabolite transporter (DMT)-like permease